jgi:hypothetical protein
VPDVIQGTIDGNLNHACSLSLSLSLSLFVLFGFAISGSDARPLPEPQPVDPRAAPVLIRALDEVSAEELRRRGAPPMALSYAKRFGEVQIDWRALGVHDEDGDDFRFVGGQRLIVEPFAGLRLEATGISVREGAEGARTWMGRIEGPTSGQVTITRHREAMFGSVDYGLDRYVLQSGRDGRIFVREADQRGLGRCAFDARTEGLPRFDQGHFDRRASTSASASAGTDKRRPASAKPTASATTAAKSNGPATVDILVLYTPEVAAGAGGNPQALIQSYVDHANQSFIDGQIQGSLNLVGTSLITGVNQALGPRATWQTRTEELQAGTGAFSGVPALRNSPTISADLVALLVVAGPEFVGGQWVSPELCGAAMGSSRGNRIDLPSIGSELGAHSITDTWCSAADLTFTHEIGHNLGGLHGDPSEFFPLADTSIQESNIMAATRHSLGYSRDEALHPFRTLMGSNTVNGDACARDLNGCPRINRWSSPNQVYHVGGWLPYPLGNMTGRCIANAAPLAPCAGGVSPQFTDMVSSHQYALPLVAQYRGAPFPPLAPGWPQFPWAHANCKHPTNTVVISWTPPFGGPPLTRYELETSPLPGFPWWATTLAYSGPNTSHLLLITAQTELRVRSCGPGGCSGWITFWVPFPFPSPPPAC